MYDEAKARERGKGEIGKKCVEDTLLKGPECETIWMPIISEYIYTCTYILWAYNLIIEICFLSVIDTLDISFNIGERI